MRWSVSRAATGSSQNEVSFEARTSAEISARASPADRAAASSSRAAANSAARRSLLAKLVSPFAGRARRGPPARPGSCARSRRRRGRPPAGHGRTRRASAGIDEQPGERLDHRALDLAVEGARAVAWMEAGRGDRPDDRVVDLDAELPADDPLSRQQPVSSSRAIARRSRPPTGGRRPPDRCG